MNRFFKILQKKSLEFFNKFKDNHLLNLLLTIIEQIYFVIYKLRLFLYSTKILKTIRLQAYVISVGNITAGGTGKTPLTIDLASYLISKGLKIAILSRGYKRKITNNAHAELISDGTDIFTNYEHSGDEPLLIAKMCPKAIVLVGKNRQDTGNIAIKMGAEVLILDDGYQHLKIERDENIVLLDGSKPFDNGHLIPKGKLREKPDAIYRATSVILSNTEDINNIEKDQLKIINQYSSHCKIFTMHYELKNLISLNTKEKLDPANVTGMRVVAACGIGNPDSFLTLLKKHNIQVVRYITFPDHCDFSYEDIQEIIKLAKHKNIDNVIITSKDAIKINDLCQAANVTFWEARIKINWNTPEIYDYILNKIKTCAN